MVTTEADFDRLSWHDCHVWGLEIRAGGPESSDWTSDLVLWIDFIVEWLCAPSGGAAAFRVAPAELVFHGVTDPRIVVVSPETGFQVVLALLSIDSITREPVVDQRAHLDRPYYRWRIELNSPPGGLLEFGAYGFTQKLLADPVVTENQHLSPAERRGVPSGPHTSSSPPWSAPPAGRQ